MTVNNIKLATALITCILLYLSACATPEPEVEITIEATQSQADKRYQSESYDEAGVLYEDVANREGAPKWMRRSAAYNAARAYALADGCTDKALDLLERAAELGFIDTDLMEQDTDLDSLRNASRWATIEETITEASASEERRWGAVSLQTPYERNLPVEDKLAGLSLLWSEAKYNFSNFDLVPELDWDAEYRAMIPRVMASENTYEYYRLLQAFVAKLEDGHANVYFPNDPAFQRGRFHVPAIKYQWIEDRLILEYALGEEFEAAGIERGDEIIAVDEVPIQDFADTERRPFVSGSVKAYIDSVVYSWRLFTGPQGPIEFTIKTQAGDTFVVQSSRPDWETWGALTEGMGQQPPNFRWRMLPDNIAYVELNSFSNPDASKGFADNFEDISKADGIVFDVRKNGGGSSNYGYDVLSRLTQEPFAVSSWRTMNYRPAYRAWSYPTDNHESTGNTELPDPDQYYSGPVAVLSGPETFSAAEDFLVAFDVMDRGPIIGQASGGSTGQPLPISLPGGGRARITTKRDTYPDGSDFVGVGVQPDISAPPTVDDFIERRDFALELASQYISDEN
ncbi:Peptidase family S41 [Planctomycetes bacterium Poly30]|uniref:Peptidase family S41 n=1 Tax=Saltatorellus ferox TaxID=2528018 RepID=A0A518EP01_9BACT|nr:Peptidase family S41 [Planctomycetes bacterium Poly30]